MSRFATLFLFVMVAAAAVGLYQVKHDAIALSNENARIAAFIERTENDISVLKAEWSHLNDPARIQGLAERHLNLGRLDIDQIARASDIPMREFPKEALNKTQLDMLIEGAITSTGSIPKKARGN